MGTSLNRITENIVKIKNFATLILLFFILSISIPLIKSYFLFSSKKEDEKTWRKLAIFNLNWFFYLSGLKFQVENTQELKTNHIYIANHFNAIDGVILLYILGENTTIFTGPSKYFPFPLSFWFRKTGCIDVQRNNIEKIKYKDSYTPEKAIKKSIEILNNNQNQSILILPEGHVSIKKRLLYFHTGATRIALASNKQIIPIGIVDIARICKKDFFFMPGTIKVIFSKSINIKEYYIKQKATLAEATLKLKQEIKKILPTIYYSKNYNYKYPEKVGFF